MKLNLKLMALALIAATATATATAGECTSVCKPKFNRWGAFITNPSAAPLTDAQKRALPACEIEAGKPQYITEAEKTKALNDCLAKSK